MIQMSQNMGDLFGTILDGPVAMSFCSIGNSVRTKSKEFDFGIKPRDYVLVQVCETKNPSGAFVSVYPSVAVNHSSDKMRNKMKWNGIQNAGISFFLEFMPSGFFEIHSERLGGYTKPCASDPVVSLKRMRTVESFFEFDEMFFITALKGNSKGSPLVVSSIIADIPICKEKSKPIRFEFGVDIGKEGWIKRIGSTSFRFSTSGTVDGYESSQDGFFTCPVFGGYLNKSHSRFIVIDNSFNWQIYPFHRLSSYICLTGSIVLNLWVFVNTRNSEPKSSARQNCGI